MPTPEETAALAAQTDTTAPIVAAAQQAVAAAEAKAAAAEAARVAAEAKLAEKDKAPAPERAAVPVEPAWMADAKKDHDARKLRERIQFARARGLDPAVMPDDVAARNLPDFDPEAADAEAKFDAVRLKYPRWFTQRGPDPSAVEAAVSAGLKDLTAKSPLFNGDKLTASVFGGR